MTETTFHKVLERQIRKVFGRGAVIPTEIYALLELVNSTYEQYDDEKELLNNTMDVSMQELSSLNKTLSAQKEELSKMYFELKNTQEKLSAAEQINLLVSELEVANNQLAASEEELKQNLEELQATQDQTHYQKLQLEEKSVKQQILNTLLKHSIHTNQELEAYLHTVIEEVSQASFLKLLPGVGIFLKNDSEMFELRAQKLLSPIIQKKCAQIKAGQCLCGLAALRKQTQYASCLDDRHTVTFEGIKPHGHYNIPILDNENVLGILVVYLEHGHPYSEDEVRFLESICMVISDTLVQFYNQQIIEAQKEELQLRLEEVRLSNKKTEEANNKLNLVLKNITASIQYAKRIQDAMLPKQIHFHAAISNFLFFKPKDIVSGDFYWMHNTQEYVLIAVADCTGHGVSGAFMTMIGNNILNHLVHDYHITNPADILNAFPQELQKIFGGSKSMLSDGMDIGILKIEKGSFPKKVCYSGAMMPFYYIENQKLIEVKGDKVPIGGTFHRKENFSYTSYYFDFKESTMLYLSTDGFKDQFGGPLDRKFMSRNFKELIVRTSSLPILQQGLFIEDAFYGWKGTNNQTDDVLVVGIKI